MEPRVSSHQPHDESGMEAKEEPPPRRNAGDPDQSPARTFSPAALIDRPWTFEPRPSPPRFLRTSRRTRDFRRASYPHVSDQEWNDWRWQCRNRVRRLSQLENLLLLSADEKEALEAGGALLPVGVTPYYLSLINPDDPDHPIRRAVIPTTAEFERGPGEADDPLGEDSQSPVPGLVHRYPDRVLFLVSDYCSTYCRYCTRSRLVGHGLIRPTESRLEQAIEYIRQTPEVRDVLLSGGDPLSLSDEKLDWILTNLRQIPHVEIIRIGTKAPAVLPQRITPRLCRMLRRHHPIWMSLHFIHPEEATPETQRACALLADAGIPLGSQTVLLRGINDDSRTMKELIHRLMLMRVRPYYLYQCDPISGSAHFRTGVQAGLQILQELRGFTSGYAIPTYVIDAPGGGGKIPLMPDCVIGRDGDHLLLRNYEDKIFRYPDPLPERGKSR